MSGARVEKKKVVAKSAKNSVSRAAKPAVSKTTLPAVKKAVPKPDKHSAKTAVAGVRRTDTGPARKGAERVVAPARPTAPAADHAREARPVARREEHRFAGITESELQRAPASQYMNDKQLAFFREHLVAMQRELLENADMTSEHLREHDIEPDPTDQATIEEEYALELRARDRERKLLKKIEQALRRIEEGSYGYCEETGEPIGIPRLLARPTATLSIEAQARRELKQKLYGD